jgi:hypothetical protein
MPVKKPIRRKKSSPRNTFAAMWASTLAWTSTPIAWTRRSITRVAHLTTSMDKSMAAALMFTGAMVVALLVVGINTTPHHAANVDELRASAVAPAEPAIDTAPVASTVDTTRAVDAPAETRVAAQIVTIAGCLAQDGDSFRLKDTSGADAPKSRSWKTAFLHKGPASLEVVDSSHHLKLTNHVGERVSVTGTMMDGEMQVRSLRRVATSCGDSKPKVNA